MKKILIIIWVVAIANEILGNYILGSFGIIAVYSILAAVGGYFAGEKLKEDVAVCAFVGVSVVVIGHMMTGGILLLFRNILGLHFDKEEAGTAYLMGSLIFSGIMPATMLGALSGVGGYIGRRYSRSTC